MAKKDNRFTVVSYSVSPIYVLITVQNFTDGSEREVCTLGTSLLAAIADEYHLDVVNDADKILEIATSMPDKVFRFKNPRARQLVAPVYTMKQLSEVKRILGGKASKELRKEVKVDLWEPPGPQSAVTKLYFGKPDSWRVAVAHVLLDAGVLVGEAHDTGTLYAVDQ